MQDLDTFAVRQYGGEIYVYGTNRVGLFTVRIENAKIVVLIHMTNRKRTGREE